MIMHAAKNRVSGSACLVLLLFGFSASADTTLELDILPISGGFKSFMAYTYTGSLDPAKSFYVDQWIQPNQAMYQETLSSNLWSHNLYSYNPPQPPNCYYATLSVTVSYTFVSSPDTYSKETAPLCYQGPPLPPPPPPPTQTCSDCENHTPILIRLDNGPYELAEQSDTVWFDLDADGSPDRVTWTKAETPIAFLAMDRNGNGAIDDGSELFGDLTRLPSGNLARNGFEALAVLDANSDGWIDVNDNAWRDLLLWVDSNHDGVSQMSEISSIASSSITALSYSARVSARRDATGNLFRYKSILREGGHSRWYYDVLLIAFR